MYRYDVTIEATTEQNTLLNMTLRAIWADNPKQAISKCQQFLEEQPPTHKPRTYNKATATRAHYEEIN